jgi:hypothetical protein
LVIEMTGIKRRLRLVSPALQVRRTPAISWSLCRETAYGITGPVVANSKNPEYRPSSAWHANTAGHVRDAGRNDSEWKQYSKPQMPITVEGI